jgi:hypothetical protein
MKNHNALFCLVLLLFILLLSSCSVGMALSGKEEMNTSILYPGVPRQAVISRLGEPVSSNIDEEGNYIDAYPLVKGNEPSSTRAVVHGTLDVFTLGLWELMATPMEVLEGIETKSEIVIYYDPEERIKRIQSTDPELSKEIELMEVNNNDDMYGDLQKDDELK